MSRITIIALLLVVTIGQAKAQSVMHYFSTGNAFPVWVKYTVVAIGNGSGGCANSNGCWSVNGGTAVNKAAALTQDVTLFQLPASGAVVTTPVIKTATACTGTTTLTATIGTTNSDTFFTTSLYDLKAAVSNTNLSTGLAVHLGSDTAVATNVVAGLIGTVQNIDQIVAGCSFSVWVMWSVRT